jgi:hypothetical protein
MGRTVELIVLVNMLTGENLAAVRRGAALIRARASSAP